MDYQKLFQRLDEKLSAQHLELSIHCVGGFVLEYHGLKATNDIDALYESSSKIDALIDEVGQEFNVGTEREAWLNNAVGRVISVAHEVAGDSEVIFKGSSLTVTLASLEDILVEKLQVGRAKDVADIAQIMRRLSIRTPDRLFQMMAQTEGNTDPAIILEAYALAYGEAALVDYLKAHPEIKRILR